LVITKGVNVSKNNSILPIQNEKEHILIATEISAKIDDALSLVSTKNLQADATPFYLPKSLTGIFSCPSHYYLVCEMDSTYKAAKNSGKLSNSSSIPYTDFITLNQKTTQTNDGIPFYALKTNYEFIVADSDYEYDGNLPILRGRQDTTGTERILAFRVIDYITSQGLGKITTSSSFTENLTPEQTQTIIPEYYPSVEYIE